MTQTIAFTDDAYFSDVLAVLLDQAVNQKLINNQINSHPLKWVVCLANF